MKIIQILSRVFVDDLDKTVEVYETLQDKPCKMRFEIPPAKVELAQVGNVLLYSGDGIEEEKKIDISLVAGGWNMILCHPDGTKAEYLEFLREDTPAWINKRKAAPILLETNR